MKKNLLILLSVFVLLTIACSEEPPSVRVKNERTVKANVQIKQADGNTININDVESGITTGFRDIVEGSTKATAVIQDESVSPEVSFNTTKDINYTVVIENSNPPKLRVDSEDK